MSILAAQQGQSNKPFNFFRIPIGSSNSLDELRKIAKFIWSSLSGFRNVKASNENIEKGNHIYKMKKKRKSNNHSFIKS